jgi:hypothetical protein
LDSYAPTTAFSDSAATLTMRSSFIQIPITQQA